MAADFLVVSPTERTKRYGKTCAACVDNDAAKGTCKMLDVSKLGRTKTRKLRCDVTCEPLPHCRDESVKHDVLCKENDYVTDDTRHPATLSENLVDGPPVALAE